jgi:hypothetical protein
MTLFASLCLVGMLSVFWPLDSMDILIGVFLHLFCIFAQYFHQAAPLAAMLAYCDEWVYIVLILCKSHLMWCSGISCDF